MKKIFVIAAVASLSACGSPETEQTETPVEEAPAVETEAVAVAAPIFETSWSFTDDGKSYRESIDAEGNYISNVITDAGEEHFDHGSYELADGKHCFTSAMNDDGQMCWTTPVTIEVGDTVEATSDGGKQLTITREDYEPLTM